MTDSLVLTRQVAFLLPARKLTSFRIYYKLTNAKIECIIRKQCRSYNSKYNNGQLKLSDEKAQLIESLRLQLKSGKLDQLSDYDASHFIVNYFKDNSISYNLLSSLLGISNKNFKTLSANGRKKIVDWVKS